jgi:hypothetical protein
VEKQASRSLLETVLASDLVADARPTYGVTGKGGTTRKGEPTTENMKNDRG